MVKQHNTGESWNFFLLKDSSKKKSKTKETLETTAISTGSTDTLRFTIRKTRKASDQANKKIASSKLFLLHLLIHTCTTQKDSINIYFVCFLHFSSSISCPTDICIVFRLLLILSILLLLLSLCFADLCFAVCLSLCLSASLQIGGLTRRWGFRNM